jgi:copper chaperone CopZ
VREHESQVEGVQGVEVSAASGRLIVMADAVSDDAVIAAVDEAGYEAVRV